MLSLDNDIIEKIRTAEVLLLGCSAGGFDLTFSLLLQVATDFPIPVIVVIHRSRRYKSSVEQLLRKKAKVMVKLADDKEQIKKGYIYFAPSDYHLLIEPEKTFALDFSEPVFYCRPAIDVTFESASDVYGEKVIGILLSGANEDGAQGLCYIEQNRGLGIVQDPEAAQVKTMPEAAIAKCRSLLVLKDQELLELIEQIGILKKIHN